MIKELKNNKKLTTLKQALHPFLDNYDCNPKLCENCEHIKVCDYILRLDIEIRSYLDINKSNEVNQWLKKKMK